MRQLQAQRVSTCGIRVLAGFGLRVEKSGTKTFIVRYRADGGGRTAPRRFATIGRFGPLTVDEARRRARVLLGAVATGEDPAGERQARRREMTITALVTLYEAEGCFVQRGIRQGEPMKAGRRLIRLHAFGITSCRCSVISVSRRSARGRSSGGPVNYSRIDFSCWVWMRVDRAPNFIVAIAPMAESTARGGSLQSAASARSQSMKLVGELGCFLERLRQAKTRPASDRPGGGK